MNQIDQFTIGLNDYRCRTLDNEIGGGDLLTEDVSEVTKDFSHILESNASIKKALDDLELQKIGISIAASAPATGSVGHRRTDKVGPGPVIELAIADTDDLGGFGTAEAVVGDALVRDSHRNSQVQSAAAIRHGKGSSLIPRITTAKLRRCEDR
ncbi:unannotated protein [freshwater metagenome]|uniref:Unannotated protein n=1 Tax=freshwater metagenome TaxID=449393 RepID=A0A6J6IJA1_9ZZZZ